MVSKRISTPYFNAATLGNGINIPASMRNVMPRISELCGGVNVRQLCPDSRIAACLITSSKLAK